MNEEAIGAIILLAIPLFGFPIAMITVGYLADKKDKRVRKFSFKWLKRWLGESSGF